MKRKNTTRNALVTSIISMLLCVSMLVGTTFAWFTDEVVSGTNVIAAGNLDVELYNSLVIDENKKVSTATKLFDEITLWEPGVVAFENLTVANLGTLALKYQLSINFTDATTNANGDTLAKVLKVGFVEGGIKSTTREGALTEVTAWQPLESFVQPGDLAVGENDVYGIVIYWQPSDIDNEFNMNNENQGKIMSINLGVKLLATQLEAESDSFGNDYDEEAWKDAVMVTDAADLLSAITKVEDGGIIALANDLTFDASSAMENNGWNEGIYYEGDKSFTIDLNGKTITNDSAVNDYLMLFKNAGSKANTITLKNGTIEAASSAYCAICTSTTSTQQITINLENVNVIGNNSNGSVVKIRSGAVLNVKDGTVITGNDSYLAVENWQATVNIYDGAEIYQNGTSSYNGCLAGVGGNGTINVYGGYGKGVKGGFIAMTSGGTINVSGGEWIANTDGTPKNDNFAALVAQNDRLTYPSAGNSVVNVTGGTFKGGYNCYGNAVGDAQLNIAGGTFNADPASYIADGYKVVAVGENYEVIEDTVNYATAATAAELQAALDNAANVNLIVLTADIVGDVTVKQISDLVITVNGDDHKFAGVFLIDGASAQETTSGVTLKNINFKADSISADACIRLGDGTAKTRYTCNVTVENCSFDVPNAVGIKSYTGGDKNLTITGCTTSADLHSLAQLKGVDGVFVENCTVTSVRGINFNNSINVTVKKCTIDVQKYALRFGSDANSTVENFAITDCTLISDCVDGDPVIELRAGATNANLTITNTTITGTVKMTGHENANVIYQ